MLHPPELQLERREAPPWFAATPALEPLRVTAEPEQA
jgi:hypothetical protein